MTTSLTEIVLVTEDEVSEVVMRRVIAEHAPRLSVDRAIRSGGFGNIRKNTARYRSASHVYPHLVLTDLDRHACPVSLLRDWNALDLPPSLCLRIAVRSVEAWLLADREAAADYLNISVSKVSREPESLPDAKRAMVDLGRASRSRRLRVEMAPEPGSRATQGPLYNAHMARFATTMWRPEVATPSAQSLGRTCARLREFCR